MVKQDHLPYFLPTFSRIFTTFNHRKTPYYSILAFIFTINHIITKTHKLKILHIILFIFHLYYTYILIQHSTKCNKFAM